MDDREKFEKWAVENKLVGVLIGLERMGDSYRAEALDRAWKVWKAAKADSERELAQVRAAQRWIPPRESLPGEDEAVLVAVACESDDHDGVTQRWTEVHEAILYRAGCQIVAACFADNAEYMDDEILGWMRMAEAERALHPPKAETQG